MITEKGKEKLLKEYYKGFAKENEELRACAKITYSILSVLAGWLIWGRTFV